MKSAKIKTFDFCRITAQSQIKNSKYVKWLAEIQILLETKPGAKLGIKSNID